MAFSASIKRAQDVRMCELCYKESPKWRCVDCEMCYCDQCNVFHLRLPLATKHQVVTIDTPIQHVQRRFVTDNIRCKDHVTLLTCMFCKTCACLVCPDCVSTSHTKHQFIPIEKALNEKLDKLRGIESSVNDKIKNCDSKTKAIQNLVTKYRFMCDDAVIIIKQREKQIMDAVSENSKALQDIVETERSMAKTIGSKVEKQVDEARKTLEDLKEQLETALTSGQGHVIFDITVIEPALNFDSLPDKVKIFIPETETTRQIQELFGSLQDMTIQVSPELNIISDNPGLVIPNPELRFQDLRTITTDLPYISKVIPLDEASVWISCSRSHKPIIRKITIQDNNIETTNEITLSIYDMALTSNNDLLVTELKCSDVKLITKSMETEFYLTVAPLRPRGIHVTNDNQVLVGAIEPGGRFTPSDQSQRAVISFDEDGKQKSVYQFDGNGKRLFNNPVRITTNNNRDIVVIDWTSPKTGKVVTLDREGKLKWTYEGHPKINGTTPFDPRGIVITSANFTIVSDWDNHALHVLSEKGNALTYNCMDDMGIMYPMTINLDKSDNFWVGCGTGGKDKGAQLHIIKMSL